MKHNNAKIIVMRHAETVWNAPRRRIQGQSLSPEIMLSEKGKKDILALKNLEMPDLLICSPLLRCRQTAEIWLKTDFEQIKIPKIIIDDLKEIDVGQLEGLYVDELSGKKKKIWILWKNHPLAFPGFPGGESLINFQSRILKAYAEICTNYNNKYQTIYIISHGGPMRILRCFVENKDLSHLWENDISNLDQFQLTRDGISLLQDYLVHFFKNKSF